MTTEPTVDVSDRQTFLFRYWARQLHQEDWGNTKDGRLVKIVEQELAQAETQVLKLIEDPGNDAYSLDDVVGALETAITELSDLKDAVEELIDENLAAIKAAMKPAETK